MKQLVIYIFVIFVFIGCGVQPQYKNSTVSYSNKKIIISDKNSSLKPTIKSEEKKENIIKEEKTKAIYNIAIIYASNNIGKYSIEATNTAMGYLLVKGVEFDLKVFDIIDETKENIESILDKLYEQNISKVIFFITTKNLNYLNGYDKLSQFNIYLPLVNARFYKGDNKNIVFGAIDYIKQFEKIKEQSKSHIVEIYDDSMIGKTLHKLFKKVKPDLISIKISGKNPKYDKILKQNRFMQNATVVLNTSIVKSSILLSQIRANEIEVDRVLSTQVNYSPLLFVLTQKADRKKFFVINSIEKLPSVIEEFSLLLGNDILYNWVNYSTLIGLEYLLTNKKRLFKKININNNQVEYNLEILQTKDNKFSILNDITYN